MSRTYHNTTDLIGRELEAAEASALSQDDAVLDYLRRHPREHLTAWDLFQAGILGSAPITSVRRALTNLTNRPRGEEGAILTQRRKFHSEHGRKSKCYIYRPVTKPEPAAGPVQTTLF